ncbi:hypothetical protein QR680_004228 [Steinernema hermaphroditum]|uniref:Uncharacterized protein n=1 Tax=Steinernema hermaphroditum TaxID=289476 RepID=A0AA39HP27_9BILA|nr:hypothetical protein QR680_004228 [Steinernema hermaphroditum]
MKFEKVNIPIPSTRFGIKYGSLYYCVQRDPSKISKYSLATRKSMIDVTGCQGSDSWVLFVNGAVNMVYMSNRTAIVSKFKMNPNEKSATSCRTETLPWNEIHLRSPSLLHNASSLFCLETYRSYDMPKFDCKNKILFTYIGQIFYVTESNGRFFLNSLPMEGKEPLKPKELDGPVIDRTFANSRTFTYLTTVYLWLWNESPNDAVILTINMK